MQLIADGRSCFLPGPVAAPVMNHLETLTQEVPVVPHHTA